MSDEDDKLQKDDVLTPGEASGLQSVAAGEDENTGGMDDGDKEEGGRAGNGSAGADDGEVPERDLVFTDGGDTMPVKHGTVGSKRSGDEISADATELWRKQREEIADVYARRRAVIDDVIRKARMENPEERKARERMERSRRTISALADGLTALGGMYYASRYAPVKPVRDTLTDAEKARQERMRQEREAEEERYRNYVMRRGELDAAELRDRRAADDALVRNWMAPAKAKRDEERAKRQARADELKEQMAQLRLNQAATRQDILEYSKEYSRMRNEWYELHGWSGGRNGSGKKYYGSLPDRNGNMVDYFSKADYEASLYAAWRGLPLTREEKKTVTNSDNYKSKTKTTTTPVKRSTGELAGEAMAIAGDKGPGYPRKEAKGY